MSVDKNTYIAVTGDIIKSRNADNSILNRLSDVVNEINSIYSIAVPFSIQAGDEIQGLMMAESRLMDILFSLNGKMYPLSFRFGIGVGRVSTALESSTNPMRGDVFVDSRKALNLAKKDRRLFCVHSRYINADDTDCINVILILLGGYLKRWKKQTYSRFVLYKKSQSIYVVAEKERVSTEAINKYIHRYNIREVLEGIRYLNTRLKQSTL